MVITKNQISSDLKQNLNLSLDEARNHYKIHLQQFDDIVRKNNSVLLANSIIISLVVGNNYLLNNVLESNFAFLLIFIIGLSILFTSLFFSLISLNKSMLRVPKIKNIYKVARKYSNLNLINALTKEYVRDIHYNSSKFIKKSNILNISISLLKTGLVIIFIDITYLIINNLINKW